MKKLGVLLYAVNGAGVGHLARLLAIARWMRRYAALLDARAEITFLTSSEACVLAFRDGFASFKLPSKTVVRDAGMSKPAYLRVAKQWVYSSIAALHPELLVVDSFPNGSFNELLPVLDTVPRKCFVYRAAKSEFATRASFQALLPLYDRILVPHEPGEVKPAVPASVRERVVHTGAVLGREREELLPRPEARARVGVPGEALCVYATAGGGGDPLAERALEAILAAARGRSGTHVVVGAGPLYRGVERHGAGVTWLSRGDAPELMNAFDVAISAGGYNAFHELLHHGVPTAFFAQAKVADSQRARVDRAVAAGAALALGARPDAASVTAALERLSDAALRAKMSDAARALVPENHARDAALEALSLVLDRRDLEEARDVASAGLLAAVRETGASFDVAAEVAGSLARGRKTSDRARERRTIERFLRAAAPDLDGARAPLEAALAKRYAASDDAEDLARGTALVLERAVATGVAAIWDALPGLVRGLARRMKSASGRPTDVARAAAVLLELVKEHGVESARALLEALPPDDAEVTPLQLELALRGVAAAARGSGGFAAVRAAMAAAEAEDPGAGSLAVLAKAARGVL